MPQIEGLTKRRSNIKGSLTKIFNYIQAQRETDVALLDIEQLKVRLRRVESLLIEFHEVEQSIFVLKPDEDTQQDEFEDKYYTAISELNKLIRKANLSGRNLSVDLSDTHVEQARTTNIEIKLPKINIAPFFGSYTEWQSFYDLFSSTIHENPNLNPAQKFQYLKGFLRGEAANLLKHLPISDANYIEALNKLKARYDRKRYTIQSFIKNFVELPIVHNPTSQQIRKLMDTADEVLRGLKAIGPEAEGRDPWLVYLLVQKLDEESRDKWSSEIAEIEFPTCQSLIGFLMKRADALDSAKGYPRRAMAQVKAAPKTLTTAVVSCTVCQNEYHPLFKCPKFKEWTVEERREFMKIDKRCFNCLSKSHTASQCRSKGRCYICKRSHNSLLHLAPNANCLPNDIPDDSNPSGATNFFMVNSNTSSIGSPSQKSPHSNSNHHQTILPTATIRVTDRSGQHQLGRVLFDSGSQISLITEAFVQKLGLERRHGKVCIQGLANHKLVTTKGMTDITISAHFRSNFTADVATYIVPFITSINPVEEAELRNYPNISTMALADRNLTSTSRIDLLIGADKFFDLLKPQQLRDSNDKTYAHNTHLGWILTGNLTSTTNEHRQCYMNNSNLETVLKRFWESEDVFSSPPLLPEDQICEEIFRSTTTRSQDNHYVVRLPFKPQPNPLNKSLSIAVKRLHAMERKFAKDSNLQQQYVEFMDEYKRLEHMTEVEPPKDPDNYLYLPHHAVLKESSTTTKLRVVFDASAKTSSGYSLNDNLLTGPILQNLIGDILLRFRVDQFVFTADAEKMYRQIWLHPKDCRYQRIVWRKTPDDYIKHFELKTLTYGMSSAPYLATRVVKQIADDNVHIYPEASAILLKDMYIDDLLTGASHLSAAVKLANQISKIMSEAGFNLRKWASNSPELLTSLNVAKSHPSRPVLLSEEPHDIKVLGLQWHPTFDTFSYNILIEEVIPTTKRGILSEASRIFDPLGLVAPFVVKIKSFFQSLWLLDLGWDDELPSNVQNQWLKIRGEIPEISTVKIPRWLCMTDNSIELHGFCDSSETAFAAAVYLRTFYNGKNITSLIAAKTKVAPIKNISLPRLELNGALLLSRLMKHIQATLKITDNQLFCWTDSTIVLDWLSEPPRRWKTYVANRTSEILEVLPRCKWRHIISKLNPADCATRGLSPNELNSHSLWWNGPEYLKAEAKDWPVFRGQESTNHSERREKFQVMIVTSDTSTYILEELIKRHSSYDKIINIATIIRTFVVKYLNTSTSQPVRIGCNWRDAEAAILRFTQQQHFNDEIRSIEQSNHVAPKSALKSLNPFLDDRGLLRVGGRIEKSIALYDTRHPIILPSKSEITTKLIVKYHSSNLHCGASLLTSLIRRKFWIIRGRNTIKSVIHNCVDCIKQRPLAENQIMGSLPKERVELIRPFLKIGVDFAGPIKTYLKRGRGQRPQKSYICLIICLSTKAVHLELVGDLTTESFMAALNRFFSRRGVSTDIFSDNGTNFQGACNKLRELNNFIKNNITLISNSIFKKYRIVWHFIPPHAPHFGGIWEAGVKSAKTYLERVVGSNTLTQEELHTLLVQIEGLLNSRPLCALSEDEQDPLTPAHFLIGHPITAIPQPDITEVPYNRLTHWSAIQRMTQLFWKRWHLEYLTSLQTRSKWNMIKENLQVNDVVLVKEENPLINQWKMGRVLQVFPGSDGRVRVAEISTSQGTFRRPITKLCRLPLR